MAHDYKTMTLKQALLLAKATATPKMTNEDISEATGLGVENVKRYFSEHDAYFPGVNKIVPLCRALGNTIIYEWMKEQLSDMLPPEAPMNTAGQVAKAAVDIGAQSGRVAQVAADVIYDDMVEPHEAAELDAELAELEKRARHARVCLQPVIHSGLRRARPKTRR